MKNPLNNLSEVVAKAIDLFYIKFEELNPIMGIIDKALRKQGMKADAITIDNFALDNRIIMLIHDDKPHTVDIAFGNKEGDIYSSSEYAIGDISEELIMKIMEDHFVKNKNEEN